MPKIIDLTGQRFGRLTVIKKVEPYIRKSGKTENCWKCICDCGNTTIVRTGHLRSGNIASCGCYQRENVAERDKKIFKKYNRFKINDDYVEFYTNKNERFIVDLDDLNKVKDICWRTDKDGYLTGWYNGKMVRLHRFIMNCPENMVVDHIGGKDSIYDNRKCNLRVCDNYENNHNRMTPKNNKSGFRGVHWDEKWQKWKSRIMINGKETHIGSFKNYEDACKARIDYEQKYYGEYSYENSQNIFKEVKE